MHRISWTTGGHSAVGSKGTHSCKLNQTLSSWIICFICPALGPPRLWERLQSVSKLTWSALIRAKGHRSKGNSVHLWLSMIAVWGSKWWGHGRGCKRMRGAGLQRLRWRRWRTCEIGCWTLLPVNTQSYSVIRGIHNANKQKLYVSKTYFWRKTQKSLFLPYIWYGKAVFLVEKRHVSAWPKILIWPNWKIR